MRHGAAAVLPCRIKQGPRWAGDADIFYGIGLLFWGRSLRRRRLDRRGYNIMGSSGKALWLRVYIPFLRLHGRTKVLRLLPPPINKKPRETEISISRGAYYKNQPLLLPPLVAFMRSALFKIFLRMRICWGVTSTNSS